MKNYDVNTLRQYLLMEDLSEINNETNPELAWLSLFKIFTKVLDKICPVTKIRVRKDRPKWLTLEIIEVQRLISCKRGKKKQGNFLSWN